MQRLLVILACSALLLTGCNSSTSPDSNAPADHIVNKNGVFHKSGLTDPLNNCTACHGSDLRGGTAGVSCFQCHGSKWE
jgi:hypothetical protein